MKNVRGYITPHHYLTPDLPPFNHIGTLSKDVVAQIGKEVEAHKNKGKNMKKKQQPKKTKAKAEKKNSSADNETAFFVALRDICSKHKCASLCMRETGTRHGVALEFESGNSYEVLGYGDPFTDDKDKSPFEVHVRKMPDFKKVG